MSPTSPFIARYRVTAKIYGWVRISYPADYNMNSIVME